MGGAVGVMWLVGVALFAPPSPTSSASDPRLAQRLQRAVQELDVLKKQNDDIRQVLQDFTKQVSSLNGAAPPHGNTAMVAELQKKLEHAQRMLQQADATADHKTG